MQPLSSQLKQLIFDYSFDLTTYEESAQAEALIVDNKEAAEIQSKLKAVLAPLDTLQIEPCPEDFAQRTVWRLIQLANAERTASAPVATMRRPWRNYVQVGAIAATILLAIGVLIPSFSFARHQHHKHVCQRQLAGISSCIDSYCTDYDGKIPAATTDVNQPWHRIGDQGAQSRSNTRNPFLLLKLGYHTRPQDFICCGRKQNRSTPLKASEVGNFNDFPSEKHIGYSFRVFCHPPTKISLLGGQPLMADRNPVFEDASAEEFDVHLDQELCGRQSMNHDLSGQNVLFTDGRAIFLRTRDLGTPHDDIFTIRDVLYYRGNERPACEKDAFLAP